MVSAALSNWVGAGFEGTKSCKEITIGNRGMFKTKLFQLRQVEE